MKNRISFQQNKTEQLATVARNIVAQITKFDKQCNSNQETDTGEAWELFYFIKGQLCEAMEPPKPVKITRSKEAKIVCIKCGPVVPRLSEKGYTVTHDLVTFNKKAGMTAHAWDGNSSKVSEEGSELIFECPMCMAEYPVPEKMELEWL